ncbi:hypothetical protein V7101_20040, partial [Bacillus velezensis]|uniref:hypothetical protein n=1 Tax=Bacillus velezensis TaxID=492670 RepID=UPI0030007C9A
MKNGHYADFSSNGHILSFSIVKASSEGNPDVTAKDVSAKFTKKSNKIVHQNIFPDIDLRNYLFDKNVKEDLILNSYKGYHQFTFQIDTDLTAIQNENGSISLVDGAKKEV